MRQRQVSIAFTDEGFGQLQALQTFIGDELGAKASKTLVLRTLVAQEYQRRTGPAPPPACHLENCPCGDSGPLDQSDHDGWREQCEEHEAATEDPVEHDERVGYHDTPEEGVDWQDGDDTSSLIE